MKNNYHGNIGSVSHGTMRPEDLIPDFITALRGMTPLHRKHRQLIREIETRMEDEKYFEAEGSIDADEDLEALFMALDSYALPYMYFGSHPGDGADYGFWLSEYFEDSFESDGGLKVSDLSEVPTGYTGEVLLVNDHGNSTLRVYSRGRGRTIWEVV